MKILVTGATGFIGRNLVKRLIEEKREVKCLVRKTSNIELIRKSGVELVYGDLLDINSLKEAVKDVSVIYHLGGAVYSSRIGEYRKINVLGTKNLLDVCLTAKLNKFIFLSSISVNGKTSKGALINEKTPYNPFNVYGRSKMIAEKLILSYSSKYNIPIVIIRAPVVYGPNSQSDLLTNNFKRVLKGKIFVAGKGDNLRSLCYIENLIDGLILSSNCEDKNKIYVISDKKAYTFNYIVDEIAKIYNINLSKKNISLIIPYFSMFILRIFNCLGLHSWVLYNLASMYVDLGCDISLAQKELDYNPKIDFKEGIKRTIDWYLQ